MTTATIHRQGYDYTAYAWRITEDHLATDDRDEAGIEGPSEAPEDLLVLARGKTRTQGGPANVFDFRMYDDDGELYYTGALALPKDVSLDDADEEAAFGPLYDFGRPNAGAVRIDFLVDVPDDEDDGLNGTYQEWETL
jgi:hypothetical protein